MGGRGSMQGPGGEGWEARVMMMMLHDDDIYSTIHDDDVA